MKHSNFINKLFIYAVLGTFVFSACSNSTSSNDEEEHADAEGFVLTMNEEKDGRPSNTITRQYHFG